jgi:hypothetical protein
VNTAGTASKTARYRHASAIADHGQAASKDLVATTAARHLALRSLPIVTDYCNSRDGEDKKAGSRVKL